MTLALMAKSFKLNYATPPNNNQKISSNPRNRKIAQPGIYGKIVRCRWLEKMVEISLDIQNLGIQNVRNHNGLIVVLGIAIQNANHNGNGNVVVAQAEDTQTYKAPVYDSNGSAECMRTRNFYYPNNSSITIPRRQNKRRTPNVVEPELRTIFEVAPMADNRTMEELLQAPTERYEEAIVIIKINVDHFEIKTNLLQSVQANPYHGFERENPHTHINNFKRITSTLKFRDVPNDMIKLMMFPYSLKGSARVWYDTEPPKSILTWEDLEMLRACPHHGFMELAQIDTFYNGLNDNHQDSLNAAFGGNLLSKTTREALQIIKNKSKVRYSRNKPNVSRMNTTTRENASKTDDRIDKLADKILALVDIFAKKVVTPTLVKTVEESCVTCGASRKSYESNGEVLSILSRFHFDISFADALLLMPKFASTIKSLLTNEDKLFEIAKIPLNENCSAMLLKKLPKKLRYPGKFIIPCDFLGMDVCHALADLGASINLMPLSIWKKLSLPELTPTWMTLELADRSITRPKGVAEDVFIKVGKFHFLTDFVVLDFEVDPLVPLSLGRSFLRTVRALIDVYGEEITLRVNDEAVTFNLNQEEYAQEILGFSKNSSGGNPTSTSEPIIFDSSPSLTSFEGSDFILEEIEAYLKDESISLEIDHADCDLEGDICLIEKLLNNDPFQFPPMDLKQGEVVKEKSFIEEPPKLELKDLPSHLEYAYLKDCIDTYETLKKKLTEAPILVIPDWNLPFELMCYASDFAIGVVLRQRKTNHFEPIHYASKTMTEAQVHYTTTKKEMLAVVDEMPQNVIKVCEIFDVWGINFMGPFPSSRGNRTAYKTPIGCTPYKLVYGKSCHLPIELEHKAYWALKHVNFDLKTTRDHQKLQLNELRNQAYKNSLIYKEKTKKLHDSKIKNRIFNVGDRVLLFNSCLKILSGKLKTHWSGPFTITKVFPYGTVELSQPDGPNFKVNGHRVKHYFGGDVPQLYRPDRMVIESFPITLVPIPLILVTEILVLVGKGSIFYISSKPRPSDTPVCYLCTCEQCGNILSYGTCLNCNSGTGNSFTYDPIPESFDESQIIPDPPPQCHFNICLCQICESNSHYGYECSQLVPLVYEPQPCYIQNFSDNDYSHDLPGVNPLIDHHCCYCGVLSEPDHCQPPQYTVNHTIFNVHNDFLYSQNELTIAQNKLMEQMTQLTSICEMACQIVQKKQEEKKIEEEQAAKAQNSKIRACCDDDDDYNSAITPNEPVDSLSMGDEHLDTISATELDEFIKSSVENLVPNLSDDDQSLSNEDFLEKIFSNPLFEEEIIPIKIDQHHHNAESDLIESMLNRDSSIISSSWKIDSLLDEFAGELSLLKSIPLGIDETDCYHENDIRLIERLLHDNSSPRPHEEFVFDNSDADIESFSPSPIPIKDSDSLIEEVDLFFTSDDPMPPGIEEDDYDSERDILILEELHGNYSLSLPVMESYHFDIPSFSRPPAKPPNGNTGILNIKMMGDNYEEKVPIPGLTITRASNQEKSPDLLSHQGLEIFQPSVKCPMMINGKNIPILDVPLFHFYPP
uniref:Reverse transcriptase domain-containing protein n=1 Tax=Tanacetum cinerariifolium TaxID=118510 RepID=A0A6L2L5Z7_TANCI|nr:reverse transcriptase domain-containing protein [Tanacetum cinerariifolium]